MVVVVVMVVWMVVWMSGFQTVVDLVALEASQD